jgi:hypothetical protein
MKSKTITALLIACGLVGCGKNEQEKLAEQHHLYNLQVCIETETSHDASVGKQSCVQAGSHRICADPAPIPADLGGPTLQGNHDFRVAECMSEVEKTTGIPASEA